MKNLWMHSRKMEKHRARRKTPLMSAPEREEDEVRRCQAKEESSAEEREREGLTEDLCSLPTVRILC